MKFQKTACQQLLLCFAQAVEAAAAGLQTSHPAAAQQPGGQVLGDGSCHGNTEKTKLVLARHAGTGELTLLHTARQH